MGRTDGRIEPGQPLAGAISARAWNRAQDAADIVLGATPGIGRPAVDAISPSPRIIVAMQKLGPESMYSGQVVEYFLDPSNAGPANGLTIPRSEIPPAASWPPGEDTFLDTILAMPSDIAQAKYLTFTGKRLPIYRCQLIRPASGPVDFLAHELHPMAGVVMNNSDSDETTVRVCIAGPVLAYVRYLFSWQHDYNACAIRPILLEDTPYEESIGLLDSHRGGGIRVLHSREMFSNSFPNVFLMPIML